jgi:hypothetical protein
MFMYNRKSEDPLANHPPVRATTICDVEEKWITTPDLAGERKISAT